MNRKHSVSWPCCVAGSIVLGSACLAAETADTIYYGGNIITMNEAAPLAEAMAVKTGVILAVGKKALTIHPAWWYREEDRKGSLEPGKLADLVILDKNPLAVDPMEIRDINVVETLKAGQTIYSAP